MDVPELPEVETIRRRLATEIVGWSFEEAWSFPSPKFEGGHRSAPGRVGSVSRRGKYLIVGLDRGRELVVHLGMTGRLGWLGGFGGVDDPHARAWWRGSDGRILVFRDARRFGRVLLVPAGDYSRAGLLGRLGPEPDDPEFTPERLRGGVARSRRPLKTLLLDQRLVAGLGNIYADEALWRAGIHPGRHPSLSAGRAERLHGHIRAVLAEGVARGGTTLRDYRAFDGGSGRNQFHLDCYGRAGQECRRCGATLRSAVIDGRTSTWCAGCQT